MDLTTKVGDLSLRSPLVAAAGTVGAVVDVAGVSAFEHYGAAVAKSVSARPWQGRPAPRLAPAGQGMLNGIGIQNPGIAAWADQYGSRIGDAPVPVWGSAVGETPSEFAEVAVGLAGCGTAAIEVNLSCPNLEGSMFALDADASADVVSEVVAAVRIPVGAKLSPNAPNIAEIAEAVMEAGASFVVLTNTMWGAGIDVETRQPLLSGVIGGYSGPPLKPVAMRCVIEVRRDLPEVPIVACGGVRKGTDVVEYLLAGASAVEIGTAHFEDPAVGRRIMRELQRFAKQHGIKKLDELRGAAPC